MTSRPDPSFAIRPRALGPVLGAALGLAAAGAAHAQESIGVASSVQNEVTRSGRPVSSGDSVFRNETIATAAASSARLTFLDKTNISIGPSSRVVLNRFVYSGDTSAQAMSVNLARGAFRFTTGALDKRAYKIDTPSGTIAVRGTVLDIRVEAGRTIVTLVADGPAFACNRSGSCVQLTTPGQSAIIQSSGVQLAGGSGFSFAQYCSANPGLCGSGDTQVAQAVDVLCGR